MPPQHGGGIRVLPTVVAWRLSYADLLRLDIVTCRPLHSLESAHRLMINSSTKFYMMRNIYFTHSSLQKEINIILSVSAVTIYSCLLEPQPSRTIAF
jgi:hypothetical protein